MDWCWLWKLKCPEEIKLFLWLLLHNALPTNVLRFQRGLATSSYCSRCGEPVEDDIQCLQNCHFAASVWSSIGFSSFISLRNRNMWDWVKGMIKHDQFSLFLCRTRWIWQWRLNLIFDEVHWSISHVIKNIFWTQQDFHLLESPIQQVNWQRVFWQPPSTGQLAERFLATCINRSHQIECQC